MWLLLGRLLCLNLFRVNIIVVRSWKLFWNICRRITSTLSLCRPPVENHRWWSTWTAVYTVGGKVSAPDRSLAETFPGSTERTQVVRELFRSKDGVVLDGPRGRVVGTWFRTYQSTNSTQEESKDRPRPQPSSTLTFSGIVNRRTREPRSHPRLP